jgi:uncharacterized YigZ family protein
MGDEFSMYLLKGAVWAEIKDRGSRFIGLCYPCKNEGEVKKILTDVRRDYPNATHYCYAYRFVKGGQEFAADDGEPSGSAGKPILNTLKSLSIVDAVGIVVRYYGGSKLGVSGLIAAYKGAMLEALHTADLKPWESRNGFQWRFEYTQERLAQRFLARFNIQIDEQRFGDQIFIAGSIATEMWAAFEREIVDNRCGTLEQGSNK